MLRRRGQSPPILPTSLMLICPLPTASPIRSPPEANPFRLILFFKADRNAHRSD